MYRFRIVIVLLVYFGKAQSFTDFQTQTLNELNRLRAFHGCPPLALDQKLCDESLEYANSLKANLNKPYLEHSKNAGKDYGEVMMGPNDNGWINHIKTFAEWAVREMYSEINNYDWNKPSSMNGPNGKPVGHFITLVWKSSTILGVGHALPDGDKTNGVLVMRTKPVPEGYSMQKVKENIPPLKPGVTKDQYSNKER